jgi:hypothetical protein
MRWDADDLGLGYKLSPVTLVRHKVGERGTANAG